MKTLLIIKEDFKSYWWINWILKVIIPFLAKDYKIIFLSFYKEKENEKLSDLLKNIEFISISDNIFPNKKNIFLEVFKLFYFAKKIKTISKNRKIDIIWSHAEFSNFASILSKKVFWNKVKIIWQIHTNPEKIWPKYQIILKKLYNYLDKLFVDSLWIKNILIENFRINKNIIKVVETFIDIDRISFLKTKKIEEKYEKIFNNWKFNFINIARLVPLKNQLWIIRAFKKLNLENNNIQLIFIWKWESKYEEQLKKEVWENKNIYFLWIQENVFKFLNKSHCFILNSLWEWFPVALLEAMWIWLPVICSAFETWSKELLFDDYEKNKNLQIDDIYIWDNWILVKLDDYKKLYKAMKLISEDKKLYLKLKEKSLTKSKQYDVKKFYKKIKDEL